MERVALGGVTENKIMLVQQPMVHTPYSVRLRVQHTITLPVAVSTTSPTQWSVKIVHLQDVRGGNNIASPF